MKRGAIVMFVAVIVLIAAGMVVTRPVANPPVLAEPAWDSPQTRALAVGACFDCHSNETERTWYSRLPIAGQLINRHVLRGREELNFSEWVRGREQEDGDEAAEMVFEPRHYAEGEPAWLPSYQSLHPEARLSRVEQERLADGLRASLRR